MPIEGLLRMPALRRRRAASSNEHQTRREACQPLRAGDRLSDQDEAHRVVLTSGPTSVAVSTPHIALLDLGQHVLPTSPIERRAYGEGLVAAVIELEHQWVRFAAVDAPVRSQIVDQEDHPLRLELPFAGGSLLDVSPFVRRVVLMFVLGATRPTVRIALPTLSAPPVERLRRFPPTASRAMNRYLIRILASVGHEHTFSHRPDAFSRAEKRCAAALTPMPSRVASVVAIVFTRFPDKPAPTHLCPRRGLPTGGARPASFGPGSYNGPT